MHIDELRAFLELYNVPVRTWGKGEAKTLEHLFSEIASGETALTGKEGELLRSGEASTVNVYYDDGITVWFLREEKQVFKDGRSRRRTIYASVGEKMQRDEDPLESAYRALSEELGIVERVPLIPKPQFIKGPEQSPSFPGIWSVYTVNVFDLLLPAHLYKPEGYIEHQADKSSYFIWQPFSDSTART